MVIIEPALRLSLIVHEKHMYYYSIKNVLIVCVVAVRMHSQASACRRVTVGEPGQWLRKSTLYLPGLTQVPGNP